MNARIRILSLAVLSLVAVLPSLAQIGGQANLLRSFIPTLQVTKWMLSHGCWQKE